jgi:regulator of cell morphogenesis and NO signaling
MLPLLSESIEVVANAHVENHPETHTIAGLWSAVQGELAQNMQKEELLLFPYIKRLVQHQANGDPLPSPPFGSAAYLNQVSSLFGRTGMEKPRLFLPFDVQITNQTPLRAIESMIHQDVSARHVYLEFHHSGPAGRIYHCLNNGRRRTGQ